MLKFLLLKPLRVLQGKSERERMRVRNHATQKPQAHCYADRRFVQTYLLLLVLLLRHGVPHLSNNRVDVRDAPRGLCRRAGSGIRLQACIRPN